MENEKEKNQIRKGKEEKEDEFEEKYKEKEELRQSDWVKGDKHSTVEWDPEKEEGEYYDTGIRPHVKLPPDESDEWPLIIPQNEEVKKEEIKKETEKKVENKEIKKEENDIDWAEEDAKDKEELKKSDLAKGDTHSSFSDE